jgi:hypothetical protein
VSRRRDEPLVDVVIELDDPAELFAVDARGLLDGSRRIDSGIDELVERLLAQRRLRSDQRIVLDIAGECPDELAANLVESFRRYGEMAVRRANRQRDLIWRQGMRSLVSGSLLFGTGIALSYLFTRPMWASSPATCSATACSSSWPGSAFGTRSTYCSSPESRPSARPGCST